jgi:hypothetical protein
MKTPKQTRSTDTVTKEVEVQFSVKWVNFIITVEATSAEDARELAYDAYKERGTDAFTIRANNEDVSSLDDIFNACPVAPRVTDDDGNLDEWCFTKDE